MINQELIDFANHLADLSCNIAQKYFRKDLGEENKADDTPVTLADKGIERLIREEVLKKYPDHGFIGEEYGDVNIEADYKWVVDPIDGTSSFVIGKPVFGTLIALTYKNNSIIGVINQPINNERWVGVKGLGVTLNGKNISSRKTGSISNSILCTTSPVFFDKTDLEFFDKVSSKTKYQKYGGVFYGGDCYLFGLMALGYVDIIIETGLKNYDYAALVPVVEESGGVITDWSGKGLDINSNGQILACGDKKVHAEIMQIANNVFSK
jgi:inositol-phosphate phosphatase/L-galactose 1-phosphate phosphatase/histidinol-phosphatase